MTAKEKAEALFACAGKKNPDLIAMTLVTGGTPEQKGEVHTHHFVNTNRCQDVYSVAKAFTVTAIGLAYDQGLIRPEDRVTDILKGLLPEGYDPRWDNVTVHHALKHCIGLPTGFLDIDTYPASTFGRDFLGYMFRAPFVRDPAGEPDYTDGAFYMLARCAEAATGIPEDKLLWDRILYPMGFEEAAWSTCPMGHPMGATGFYITTEEMAALGELYRLGGVYEGKRLISSDWAETVLTRGYELNPTGVGDFFGKGGYMGQMVCSSRKLGLTVAWQAYGEVDWKGILQALL